VGAGRGEGEVEGVYIPSYQQNKLPYGRIKEGDGVMFITYSSLVATSGQGSRRRSRLGQVC
ncbi:unnamed protein product, partial [Discosporangium mesarthrocarpum]